MRVFAVDMLALRGRLDTATKYGLLCLMKNEGWQWQMWKPPSKRKKHDLIPIVYLPGYSRTFYTTPHAAAAYMRCLIEADAGLFSRDLEYVPHGFDDSQYKKILAGDFRLEKEQPLVITYDLDDGHLGQIDGANQAQPATPLALQDEVEGPNFDHEFAAALEEELDRLFALRLEAQEQDEDKASAHVGQDAALTDIDYKSTTWRSFQITPNKSGNLSVGRGHVSGIGKKNDVTYLKQNYHSRGADAG